MRDQIIEWSQWLREAPLKLLTWAFGHCPNSFCTPHPALNWALWGTSSLKKCPKPSRQGFRPPPLRAMPKCLLHEFERSFPYRVYTLGPLCLWKCFFNFFSTVSQFVSSIFSIFFSHVFFFFQHLKKNLNFFQLFLTFFNFSSILQCFSTFFFNFFCLFNFFLSLVLVQILATIQHHPDQV